MSFTILPDILRLAWPACFTNAAQKSLVRNSTRARVAYRNSSNSRLSPSPQFHTWTRYLKPQTAPLAFANRPSVSRMRALCPPVKTPSGSAAFFLYATTAPPKPHSTQVLAFSSVMQPWYPIILYFSASTSTFAASGTAFLSLCNIFHARIIGAPTSARLRSRA